MPFEFPVAEATRPASAEPPSVGVLCYPEIDPDEIGSVLGRLAGTWPDGAARWEAVLVGTQSGSIQAARGARLRAHYSLGPHLPVFDLLVVGCEFVSSSAFSTRDGMAALLAATLTAERVLMTSRRARHARCAQVLLRAASGMPSGAFWEATRPSGRPGETKLIADGRLTWAIGPAAVADGIDHALA